MNTKAKSSIKEQRIYAKIKRADGTVEDLGLVGYHHKNPLKQWYWNARIKLKEKINGYRGN